MIDIFWKFCNCLYNANLVHTVRIFELLSMCISSHAVSGKIKIGNNSKFYHHALGCTVLSTTVIGENCKIFQNVTIGNTFGRYHQDLSVDRSDREFGINTNIIPDISENDVAQDKVQIEKLSFDSFFGGTDWK